MTHINSKFANIKENSIGALYVIATPIGNLEDITFRAVRILKEVDYIICEDSSHSLKLLNHFGITNKLIVYNDHSFNKDRNKIVEHLLLGKKLALISDAGTPLISDPGFKLISRLHELNIQIIPIPGASSVIAALSVAGIPTDKFLFLGFLPNNSKKSEIMLNRYKDINASLVLFESPKRVKALLSSILQVLGNRKACLVRELTKIHEEIVYDDVANLYETYKDQKVKGEIVILIEGNTEEPALDDEQIAYMLRNEVDRGVSFSEAIKSVSKRNNLNKKRIYDIAIRLKKNP
jgi:16S rRNA (cytidine1402-2'-O)-methyltransferase